jgi:hypothetical protein
MLVVNRAKCSAFSKRWGTRVFWCRPLEYGAAGDLVGLQLKEQVHVLLHAHQCSTSNVAPNPSIRELSPWLRIFRRHELAINHIIPVGTPLDHVKQASVLPTPISGEFNLDCLPLMV